MQCPVCWREPMRRRGRATWVCEGCGARVVVPEMTQTTPEEG